MDYYTARAEKLRARWRRFCVYEFCRCIARYWRYREVKVELSGLSERSLHDIGIAYCDIPAIANGAYLQDASRRQRGQPIAADTLEDACRFINALENFVPVKGETAMAPSMAEQSREIAENWIESWNRRDLDALLGHFSENFEFSSPLIHQVAGEPSGRLIGKAAVRAYWQAALSRLPNLRFELVQVFSGVDCITILYRGHRGLSAEVLQFGADNLVLRGQALYMADT